MLHQMVLAYLPLMSAAPGSQARWSVRWPWASAVPGSQATRPDPTVVCWVAFLLVPAAPESQAPEVGPPRGSGVSEGGRRPQGRSHAFIRAAVPTPWWIPHHREGYGGYRDENCGQFFVFSYKFQSYRSWRSCSALSHVASPHLQKNEIVPPG